MEDYAPSEEFTLPLPTGEAGLVDWLIVFVFILGLAAIVTLIIMKGRRLK